MKHNQTTKKLRNAQKGHLEKGKPQRPTKDTKNDKIIKRARKTQIKAKLKINTSPEINSP
jgi:hypothetical protein